MYILKNFIEIILTMWDLWVKNNQKKNVGNVGKCGKCGKMWEMLENEGNVGKCGKCGKMWDKNLYYIHIINT